LKFLDRVVALAAELDRHDYYRLLGLTVDCPDSAVSPRYYELAPRFHPDRFVRRANAEQLSALNRLSARLTEARKVLTNPVQRARYDAGLADGKLRLIDDQPVARRAASKADPQHPLARDLFAKAKQFVAQGDRPQGLLHMQLARKYEPNSAAIASALGELTAHTKPAPSPSPSSATAVPIPAPVPTPATSPPLSAKPEPITIQPSTSAPQTSVSRHPPPLPTDAAPDGPLARRHARLPVALRVKIRLATWQSFEQMVTRDLSRGGLFLRSPQRYEVGAQVTLAVETPDGGELEIPARVARLSHSHEEAGFGLEFLEIPESTKRHIDALLEAASRPTETGTPPPESSVPNLEELVAELLRIRSLTPAALFGGEKGLDREAITRSFQRMAARFQPGTRAGKDTSIAEVSREIIAHLRAAYQSLCSVPGEQPAPDRPSQNDSTVPRADTAGLELRARHTSTPPRGIAPLPSRPVLSPSAPETALLVERVFELIARGQYEEALEQVTASMPSDAPPRLRAARHVALGCIAKQEGMLDEARRQFEIAVRVDKTCREAILMLRNT
jgi:Tfp pilus assembly protein PilZ